MADIGVFTKNADIQAKAGVNANATAKAVASTDVYVLNVEAYINIVTRYNWSDAYAALNADVKGILTDCGACFCAMNVVAQDGSGYTSRLEMQTLLDYLRDRALNYIDILRDKAHTDFIIGA